MSDLIDWKCLAKTKGYRSLKAAYISDVQRDERSKNELLKKFQWVIARAKHYSHKTEKSIEVILNEWEEHRDYWWLNYYQPCRQPKLHSNCLKPIGLKGLIKQLKQERWYTPAEKYRRIKSLRKRLQSP